ncbi:MAG: hypothetical protein U1F77_00145 [Kiritimatiellia bacterium]
MPTRYFRFAFFVEPGFVADIDRVEFDYKSQLFLSFGQGRPGSVLLAGKLGTPWCCAFPRVGRI